jgi:hypothetical protein
MTSDKDLIAGDDVVEPSPSPSIDGDKGIDGMRQPVRSPISQRKSADPEEIRGRRRDSIDEKLVTLGQKRRSLSFSSLSDAWRGRVSKKSASSRTILSRV